MSDHSSLLSTESCWVKVARTIPYSSCFLLLILHPLTSTLLLGYQFLIILAVLEIELNLFLPLQDHIAIIPIPIMIQPFEFSLPSSRIMNTFFIQQVLHPTCVSPLPQRYRICLQCRRQRRCGFDLWVRKIPW